MIITWRNRMLTAIIFLVFLVAVIEGAGYLYTLGRIQHGARWGVRYAVPEVFDVSYCEAAASALNLLEADLSDGDVDCKTSDDYCDREGVSCCSNQPSSAHQGVSCLINQLTDWARLPSIRDQALTGSSGVNINLQVSGDYLEYLKTHDKKWLGDPGAPGYFHVTVCSRPSTDSKESRFGLLWDGVVPLCFDDTEKVFMDNGGDGRERVMVVVVYNHAPVIPWLRWIWPIIPMMVSREGVVEYVGTPRISSTPPPTPMPFPTLTPLPKNWLGVSQNLSGQASTLSYLLIILLVVGAMGGFYVRAAIKAFLKLRQS